PPSPPPSPFLLFLRPTRSTRMESSAASVVYKRHEQNTHNIFYTAITRAKTELKIYWSAETENKILKSLKIKDIHKDFHLFKNNIQNIKTLKN
ncbi:hypothetical protein PQR76_09010, partial [Campylobacter coli]|nr:hypothetical protein [Campylobacter coli]